MGTTCATKPRGSRLSLAPRLLLLRALLDRSGNHHLVTTRILGFVHRRIRGSDQLLRRVAAVRVLRDADAEREVPFAEVLFGHTRANPLRDERGRLPVCL